MPLAVALLLLPGLAWAAEVTYLKRPAEIKRRGTTTWQVLNLGDEVNAGDAIRTGFGGRVEVTLSSRRVFRVGEATEIEMPQLEDSEEKGIRARFRLLLGRFWGGLIRPLTRRRGQRFEVSTTVATIGVKGTQFGMDHDKATEQSKLLVLDGVVAAVPPGGEIEREEVPGPREVAPPQEISEDEWLLLVERDQKLVIRPDEAPRVEPITPEERADEWVQFNLARDRALAAQ